MAFKGPKCAACGAPKRSYGRWAYLTWHSTGPYQAPSELLCVSCLVWARHAGDIGISSVEDVSPELSYFDLMVA